MTPQERQQIKARFFGMHIGCDVNVLLNGKEVRYATNAGIIIGRRDSVLVNVGDLTYYSDEQFDIKLILRPLSDITDEEACELAKELGFCCEKYRITRHKHFIDIDSPPSSFFVRIYTSLTNTDILESNSEPRAGEFIDSIDYLRSCNFALPYMGLDSVKEGWAVLETVNQPQGTTPTE